MKHKSWVQEYLPLGQEGAPAESAVEGLISEVFELSGRYLSKHPSEWKVLDVGCGQGYYVNNLSKKVRYVVGVEPFKDFCEMARELNKNLPNVNILNAPIEDVENIGEFDLILSITTIEHMPHARRSVEKMIELLKPGGVLFVTAPNKLWPLESHYRLLFLSWLPLKVADFYLRISGRGTSYQSCSYSKTYWGMKRLFKGLPCHFTFVLPDLQKNYLGAGHGGGAGRILRSFGVRLIKAFPAFWTISKGFMILAVKDQRS